MSRLRTIAVVTVVVVGTVTAVAVARAARAPQSWSSEMILGAEVRMGSDPVSGTVSSFAHLDRRGVPLAIGVVFAPGLLEQLPVSPSDEHHCYDHDGSGGIDADRECIATHERVIPLPPEVTRRPDIPFEWVLMNWNPGGHAPVEIYGLPHFDIHYVIEPIENIFAIVSGPCGPEFIRCDQFQRAVRPVPARFMHPDFVNVDAAAPAMGNHLVDPTSHEFHGELFDRTWMYGAYDGRVTFYEEMVTREYLRGLPDTCFEIKTVPEWEVAGYYPTRSCFRYDPRADLQAVTMEGFVYREASEARVTE